MTERERTYVDVVFAAADIYERELRAAHRVKKKSLTGYMQAVDAATEKRDAVEAAAWRRYLATPASRPMLAASTEGR